MKRKFSSGLVVLLAVVGVGYVACAEMFPSGTWRYKMTVTVETPEGIKTGSAVREVVNDTFIYESGLDIYSGADGNDVASISNSAITAANMTLVRSTASRQDLHIYLNGSLAFTSSAQFSGTGGLETIKFYNGSTFDLTTVQYTTNGTSGADTLYGIGMGGNLAG